MTAEQKRKRMKKDRKAELRREYKHIMYLADESIFAESFKSWCDVKIDKKYRFATWLAMKKLERKGYKCLIIKNFAGTLEDCLEIRW